MPRAGCALSNAWRKHDLGRSSGQFPICTADGLSGLCPECAAADRAGDGAAGRFVRAPQPAGVGVPDTSARWAIVRTSPRSWVTTMMVGPRSVIRPFNRLTIAACTGTSSADVTSPQTNSSGLSSKARASSPTAIITARLCATHQAFAGWMAFTSGRAKLRLGMPRW